jgi:hypothetical protein
MANRKKREVVLLGKEIKIPANAEMTVNKAGQSTTWYVDHVEILIGIGIDHTATLIMSRDAHAALIAGEKLQINEGTPVE